MNPYITIPSILKETAEGMTRHAILDELFQHREIQCIGEITPESVHAMILQLRYLYRTEPNKGITLYINSPGGEVASGLALYDVIEAISCPVRTVCVGTAASMAALLFCAGDQRDILPHGRVMIHDPLISGGISGSALKIDSISKNLLKTRETTAAILAKHTGRSLEEIYEKTACDSYFDAAESVEFGLADRIIYEM